MKVIARQTHDQKFTYKCFKKCVSPSRIQKPINIYLFLLLFLHIKLKQNFILNDNNFNHYHKNNKYIINFT